MQRQFRQKLYRYYKQAWIRGSLKVVVIVVALLTVLGFDWLPAFLTVEGNVLYMLVLALLALEVVESSVYTLESDLKDAERNIARLRKGVDGEPKVFGRTRDAYDRLNETALADLTSGDRIYLIHYLGSSLSTRYALRRAIDTGSEVFLLLKHPETIAEPRIRKHVFIFIEAILFSYYFSADEEVNVRFYRYQASVNAMKVGRDHVGVGWYTFHDENGFPRKVNDEVNPTIVYEQEHSGYFEVVNNWFEEVFAELWRQGETLEEMYADGEGPERLVEWVDETDTEEKKALLDRTSSDHPTTRETLFPDR